MSFHDHMNCGLSTMTRYTKENYLPRQVSPQSSGWAETCLSELYWLMHLDAIFALGLAVFLDKSEKERDAACKKVHDTIGWSRRAFEMAGEAQDMALNSVMSGGGLND